MSGSDWKRLSHAGTGPASDGIVVKIEVRAGEPNDVYALLISVRRDAARLAKNGAIGTWEAQWCSGAARISIARSS